VRVELDENLGAAGAAFLKAAGVDVVTRADKNLLSTAEADILRICAAESRCLVTLDRDFSDLTRKVLRRRTFRGPEAIRRRSVCRSEANVREHAPARK
jgi:predicted nuclease of predicted toxin-antitoxin system